MYERMSIEEYSAYERENGTGLCKAGGIWWREVRPFFYRPLHPLQRLDPGRAEIPLIRQLIGYQHLVSDPKQANSRMRFFVLDRLEEYSLDRLPSKVRWEVNRSRRQSELRPIATVREFVDAGYPVYLAFYERTHYGWRSDRTDREIFQKWAEALYRYPRMRIMGAYSGSLLNAVAVSYLVDDVVFYATLFCNGEALRTHASDLMLHDVRETAANSAGAKYIFMGAPGNRRGLDTFKIRRKCRILNEPARFRINPVAVLLLKLFSPGSYRKLRGEAFSLEKMDRA